MIDRAMNIMDQSKNLPPEQQFAWTGPGWVMSKVLDDWDGQTPARRQRLDDYVKAGRLQFHALPFTLESAADMNDAWLTARRSVDFAPSIQGMAPRILSIPQN